MSSKNHGYDAKAQIRDALATSTSESLEQMRKARTELVLGVYSGVDESDMYEQRKRLQAWLVAAYTNLLPFRSSVNQWERFTLWETEDGREVPVDYIEQMFSERERTTQDGGSLASTPEKIEVPKVYPWQHLVAASRTLDELAGDAIMNRRPAYHAGEEKKYPDDEEEGDGDE